MSVEQQLEWSAGPLPSGRHGLSRDYVLETQRTRLLGAALEIAGTTGYASMTVSAITRRAGVSRKTFYEQFEDRQACFLAVYERVLACGIDGMRTAYEAEETWAEGVRAALGWLARALAERPREARVAFVEAYAAGAPALAEREAALARIARLFEPGEAVVGAGASASPLVAEAVVGGLAEVIYTRVRHGRTRELPDLLPELVQCALAPFLGPAKAAALAAGKAAPGSRRKPV